MNINFSKGSKIKPFVLKILNFKDKKISNKTFFFVRYYTSFQNRLSFAKHRNSPENFKSRTMKKNKISYDTGFWASFVAGNPFTAIDAFFNFEDLDYYKQNLTHAVTYSYKTKVYKQENPGNAFIFYTALCSFLKISYCLKKKSKKWKVKASYILIQFFIFLP